MTIIPSRKKAAPARASQSPSDLPAPTSNSEPLGEASSDGAEPFMRLEIDGRRITVRLEAVSHCARDHVAFVAQEPGGAVASGAHSVAVATPPTPYAALRAYLDDSGTRRFIDLRQPGARVPRWHVLATAPGYCGLYRGHPEIWLPHACFERVAGGPAQARALKAELHAKGLIVSERRGQRRCFSIKRDVPGLGRVRVVALRLTVIAPPPVSR